MSTAALPPRVHRSRPRAIRAAGSMFTATALSVALVVAAMPASAYWNATGSGAKVVTTAALAVPSDVTVPAASSGDVAVDWTPGAGGVAADGYYVTRSDGVTTSPACASSPTVLVATSSCTDTGVPDGDYGYVVTAVRLSWTAASAASSTVTVVDATRLAFRTQPTDTLPGALFVPAVSVGLETADGTAVDEAGVTVTMTIGTNPSDGTLAGVVTAATGDDGAATFDDLSIDLPGVGYTLTASGAGLTAATSDPFTVPVPAFLGSAATYSVLAATAVVNTGATNVSGDLGAGTTASGFPPGVVAGDIHAADDAVAAAQAAFSTAYDDLASRAPEATLVGDLGGVTLPPGVFHSVAALAVTGTLTLDAADDPAAVFVISTDAALNTAAASVVSLVNGAQPSNVFWVVAGAAGTGASSTFSGTILAQGAITLGAGTLLIGQALSGDAVTLGGGTIRFTAALPPTIVIDGGEDAATQDTTPMFSGTSDALPGSTVTVTVAGQNLRSTVTDDGTWSVTAAPLAAGPHTVVAKVRDASGNGATASQQLTVEVNPPTVVLGTAATYSVLAATAVVNTGLTQLSGDLGLDPGPSVTGFPPGGLDGVVHIADLAAGAAQADLLAALADAAGRPAHTQVVGDLGGRTFHIGVHHSVAALSLTGTVTLDAEGDPDAVFILQTDAALNTAAGSVVSLVNGAQASNVFWVVAGAAGTGANSSFSGAILAQGAITLGAGTQLVGQALSRDAVTLAGDSLTGVGAAPLPEGARRAQPGAPETAETPGPAPSVADPERTATP